MFDKGGYEPDGNTSLTSFNSNDRSCIRHYTCTNEILAGLGKMCVADERFKKNIDKYGKGITEFVSNAIGVFCILK